MTEQRESAHFDDAMASVVIEHVVVTDADVVREAQRWIGGKRGPIVDDREQLEAANLAGFVTEAVKIGAHALSVTGQAQEAKALDQMLKEVGEKTAQSSADAAAITQRAVRDASVTLTKTVDAAQKALSDADAKVRKDFAAAVTSAKTDLNNEIQRIVGGESPELLDRLRPLLDQFGTKLDARVGASTTELISKAARQFDPSDPTSPMAKHQAALAAQQDELAKQLASRHQELTTKIDDIATALTVRDATADLASVTPLKGDSYADQVHQVMADVAAGLGDEYVDTSATTGRIPRNKKGDGVLIVNGGACRVVLEMTDSVRTGWTDYFDEAERNRDAAASLGLVRTLEQNDGHVVRIIGPRRFVLTFDPRRDDTDLFRTVVMLLRTVAVAASSRHGADEIATAEEKVQAAVDSLDQIDDIKKLAGLIGKNAEKIDNQLAKVNTTIRRLLAEAMNALAGTEHAPVHAVRREGAA